MNCSFCFSSCNFFSNVWSLKPWIRIGTVGIQPDPDEIKADPQPYLEYDLLPGLQRWKPAPYGVQPLPELLTGEAHRMAVDVGAGAAAWCNLLLCGSGTFLDKSDPGPDNIIPDHDPVPDPIPTLNRLKMLLKSNSNPDKKIIRIHKTGLLVTRWEWSLWTCPSDGTCQC